MQFVYRKLIDLTSTAITCRGLPDVNTEEGVESFITSSSKGHCTYQRENDDECDGREEDAGANSHDGYIGCYLHFELP
jgi:hypothetical protein